jgi:DNA-binding MarR family transcriptional regulator
LTESGVRLRGEVAALSDKMYRGLTHGFSAKERKELMSYLLRLRENLPALSMLASGAESSLEEMH